MATQDDWADAPLIRGQSTLFSPTLDEMLEDDSQGPLLDEVLATADWSEGEAEYNGKVRQPPIHPRWIAGVILYGTLPGNPLQPQIGVSACRDDPTQPVPEEQWPHLPRNGPKRLAKSSFAYDAEHDLYYCPQGHAMPFEKTKPDDLQSAAAHGRDDVSPS